MTANEERSWFEWAGLGLAAFGVVAAVVAVVFAWRAAAASREASKVYAQERRLDSLNDVLSRGFLAVNVIGASGEEMAVRQAQLRAAIETAEARGLGPLPVARGLSVQVATPDWRKGPAIEAVRGEILGLIVAESFARAAARRGRWARLRRRLRP